MSKAVCLRNYANESWASQHPMQEAHSPSSQVRICVNTNVYFHLSARHFKIHYSVFPMKKKKAQSPFVKNAFTNAKVVPSTGTPVSPPYIS